MWQTIGIIVLILSVLSVLFKDIEDAGYYLKKIVLFIPMLLIGAILIAAEDFKNHRLGYILLFLVLCFLGYGVYMGIQYGPSSPAPWE